MCLKIPYSFFERFDFKVADVLEATFEQSRSSLEIKFGYDAESVKTVHLFNVKKAVDIVGKKVLTIKNASSILGEVTPIVFVDIQGGPSFLEVSERNSSLHIPISGNTTERKSPIFLRNEMNHLDLRIAQVISQKASTDSLYFIVNKGSDQKVEETIIPDIDPELNFLKKNIIVITNIKKECIHDFAVHPLYYEVQGKNFPFLSSSEIAPGTRFSLEPFEPSRFSSFRETCKATMSSILQATSKL